MSEKHKSRNLCLPSEIIPNYTIRLLNLHSQNLKYYYDSATKNDYIDGFLSSSSSKTLLDAINEMLASRKPSKKVLSNWTICNPLIRAKLSILLEDLKKRIGDLESNENQIANRTELLYQQMTLQIFNGGRKTELHSIVPKVNFNLFSGLTVILVSNQDTLTVEVDNLEGLGIIKPVKSGSAIFVNRTTPCVLNLPAGVKVFMLSIFI